MSRRFLFAAFCALAISAPAHAWWGTVHSFITLNSLQQLPEPLHSFIVRTFPTVQSHATNEPPGAHFIDIDYYPEFQAGQMPRDLNVLYNKYGFSTVQSKGISPWSIADYRKSLTAQMLAAKTPAAFNQLAQTAGDMAHYIEDINQPLHTTLNYDGQYTGNSGIHARYEGMMIEPHFADLPITAAPQNCVYVTDTVDWILDSIEGRTYQYVRSIMAADTLARTFGSTTSQAYFNSLWNSTGDFTHSQLQYATEMVASAWYSAWIDAGSPALGISGDYNNNGIVDAADYTVWREGLGPIFKQSDYDVWRTHFGLSLAGAGASAPGAVPEPATIELVMLCLVVCCWHGYSWRRL
jgi:hypothetical protein